MRCREAKSEPIEDYRIDFEDGFGIRSEDEEDHYAETSAKALAELISKKSCPPYYGLRIKDFSPAHRSRAVRTLDIFLTTFVHTLRSLSALHLFDTLLVTIPKLLHPEQLNVATQLCDEFERRLALPPLALKLEVMIEAPSNLSPIFFQELKAVAGNRLFAMHLGAYDLTSACHVAAHEQTLDHPLCDAARVLMVANAADSDIAVADGAVTTMPIGPYKSPVSPTEVHSNTTVVHHAWQVSARHIHNALRLGIYQGWDLHPAQIPIRYGVLYAFFQNNTVAMAKRLTAFLTTSAQATLSGVHFDDAATGQGLVNFFVRAMAIGAIKEDEVLKLGFLPAALRTRCFSTMLIKS